LLPCFIALVLLLGIAIPVFAAAPGFPNMAGTWNVTSAVVVKNLSNTRTDVVRTATLVISDNTTTTKGVITTATLSTTNYGTCAVTGFVGQGYYPVITLIGNDANSSIVLTGRVIWKSGAPYKISGRMDGYGSHSQGALGDDPVAAAATWSSVDQHSGTISALLTQAAAAGSTYVQFAAPTVKGSNAVAGIQLSELDTILVTDWGLWYNLENAKNGGPQLELRFTAPTNVNPDGVGHVDVTLLVPTAGTGEWVNRTYNGDFLCVAYGNDPWDGTAFAIEVPTALSGIEAAINAKAEMIADGPFSASAWTLTRVRVEIWDAGARTCYVDDVEIAGVTYSFEPVTFSGAFTALK